MLSSPLIRPLIRCSAILLCLPCAEAQTVLPLFESGSRDERINVVIIAEGFTEAELVGFPTKATELADHLFEEDPFKAYKAFFNAYAISIVSNESGADVPSDEISVDTAFDATFEAFGIARLLTVSSTKVLDMLNNTLPEYDIIMVLVNSTRYGGSGGFVSVASLNSSAFEIASHEIGHSFGGLADEYESPDADPHEAPNATAQVDREQVKWKIWFEQSTPVPTPETEEWRDHIGLFEGAVYRSEDWFRPHFDSKMRSLGRAWGAVNQEQLTLRIYQSLPLLQSPSPSQSFITIAKNDPLQFSIEKTFDQMQIEWRLNEEVIASGDASFVLDPATLENGLHQLQARVFDTSPFVRNDPLDSLSDPYFWTLDVDLPSNNVILFENWIQEKLPNDANERSTKADPDHDSIDNLSEFFWNTDPSTPDTLSEFISTGQENGVLYIDLFRERNPIDITAYIEGSDNLDTWTLIAKSSFGQAFEREDPPISIPLSDEANKQRVYDHETANENSQRFLRLRLEHQRSP